MLALIVIVTAITACLAGWFVKWITDRNGTPLVITAREFAAGIALITCAVAPLSGWSLYKVALHSRATFKEFHNGYETRAVVRTITCSRDGPCYWAYDCDPYIVMVSYECGTSKSPQTCYRPETRYHHCPYVTQEYDYTVETTLGPYTFAENRFPDAPDRHRWRGKDPAKGTYRTRWAFALFPTAMTNGRVVWWEKYRIVEVWTRRDPHEWGLVYAVPDWREVRATARCDVNEEITNGDNDA